MPNTTILDLFLPSFLEKNAIMIQQASNPHAMINFSLVS